MNMKAHGSFILLLLLAFPAAAAEPRTICFGNEPSWGLHFTEPGGARLELPDSPPVAYQGSETRLDFIRERAWRGKPTTGGGGDLVAFLSDSVCSDGMSDKKHPVTARVSLADGRFLAGCCRIVPASSDAPEATASIEGPTWRLTDLRGLDPGVLRDMTRPVTAGFKAGRISGFSGCNQFFGPYTLDRDRVVIGPLAGSMMACEQPAMKVENAVHAALAGTFRYVLADRRLTLFSGTEPDPGLRGGACARARGGDVDGHRIQQWPPSRRESLVGHLAFPDLQGRAGRGVRRVQLLPRDVYRRGGSYRDRACGRHPHELRGRRRHATGA